MSAAVCLRPSTPASGLKGSQSKPVVGDRQPMAMQAKLSQSTPRLMAWHVGGASDAGAQCHHV